MGFLSNLVDATPGVGTLKAVYHYTRGEEEKGDEALYQSTRSLAVIGGGLVGGPAGAIGAGAATDAAASALMKKEKGFINSCKNISDDIEADRNPMGSIASAGTQLLFDGMSGYGGSSGGVSKASSKVFGKTMQKGGEQVIQKSVRISAAEAGKMVGRKASQRAAEKVAERAFVMSTHVGLTAMQRTKLEEQERREREWEERERERRRRQREWEERERERRWREREREREQEERDRPWWEREREREQEERERQWWESEDEEEPEERERKWWDSEEEEEPEERDRHWWEREREQEQEERERQWRKRETEKIQEEVEGLLWWYREMKGELEEREGEARREDEQTEKEQSERQQKSQEECRKKEQRANSEKKKSDTSGSNHGSPPPPQGNKNNNNKKRKKKGVPFETFMKLLKKILIIVYGNESEPFSSIFEDLSESQRDYLSKVLGPLQKFGTLEVVIELVIKLFKEHFSGDISFLNFLSLLEFVQTYISDELLERTRISSGTETEETKMTPEERREKIISEIVNEKDIAENLMKLFNNLKTEIKAETAAWSTVLPNFRDIFAAVYHYFKHRRLPHDGSIISVREYYDWIKIFSEETKNSLKLYQLKDSEDGTDIHEVFVPRFFRRFRLVFRVYDGEIMLCSAYVVDKIHPDDKEKHAILVVAEVMTLIFTVINLFLIFKNIVFYGPMLLLSTLLMIFNFIAFIVSLILNTLLFIIACFIFILKVLFYILSTFLFVWFLFYHLPDKDNFR